MAKKNSVLGTLYHPGRTKFSVKEKIYVFSRDGLKGISKTTYLLYSLFFARGGKKFEPIVEL